LEPSGLLEPLGLTDYAVELRMRFQKIPEQGGNAMSDSDGGSSSLLRQSSTDGAAEIKRRTKAVHGVSQKNRGFQ
jgi:methylmalonyl-CoA mutase N-terminal domain/subunit